MKKYCADKRWHMTGWIKERVQDWYDIQPEKRIQQVDRLLKDYQYERKDPHVSKSLSNMDPQIPYLIVGWQTFLLPTVCTPVLCKNHQIFLLR